MNKYTYKELMEMKLDILEEELRRLEDIRQEQRKLRDDVEFVGGEIKQINKRANEFKDEKNNGN